VIRAVDLALPQPERRSRDRPERTPADKVRGPSVVPPAADRDRIQEALERAQGVVSKAAAELGLSRQALYRRMERLGMSVERRIKE
jgi:transcriptional regulator with GAF, ATPase, and Fis domain